MTALSSKAFAIMAVCEETKKTFGITVDYISQRHYKFVWTFKIGKEKAHREGYDSKTVTGSVELDPNYPGCPYCGSKKLYMQLRKNCLLSWSTNRYLSRMWPNRRIDVSK